MAFLVNDPTQNFATAARIFCSWVESPPGEPSSEVVVALRHLMRLYRAALELPERFEDFDAPRVSDEEWKVVFRRFGSLPFNYYAECFDPLTVPCEEPVVSDLADDLADIWRDIKAGLVLYETGHPDAAVWEWKQHFQFHWGITRSARCMRCIAGWRRTRTKCHLTSRSTPTLRAQARSARASASLRRAAA